MKFLSRIKNLYLRQLEIPGDIDDFCYINNEKLDSECYIISRETYLSRVYYLKNKTLYNIHQDNFYYIWK